MDQYAKNCKIFIDTCSIMCDDNRFNKFLSIAIPFMKKYNNKFIIALQVIKELEKYYNDVSDKTKSDVAKNSLNILVKLQKENLIKLQGDEKDGVFADRVFDYVFSKFKTQHKLFLITQDKELAMMILDKNKQNAVKGKTIICKRIESDGSLRDFCYNA